MASLPSAFRTTAPLSTSHRWHGLTPFRKRRVRHVTHNVQADLRLKSLTAALASALRWPNYGLELSSRIAGAAKITYCGSLHATIINQVAARAIDSQGDMTEHLALHTEYSKSTINATTKNGTAKHINKMNCGMVADLAIETFIRLSSSTRTTPAALVAVTEICARDQVVERRGTRAASVLRFIQYNRTLSTYAVYKALFEAFVEALDYQAALATLNYVHSTYTHISIPDRAHWYDRFIYAALVRRELGIVEAALTTKKQLGLPDDSDYARNIKIALDAERGDFGQAARAARRLIKANRSGQKVQVEPFVFAYLIKGAGKMEDVNVVLEWYKLFENSIEQSRVKFYQSLSLPTFSAAPRLKKQAASSPEPHSETKSTSDYSLRSSDEAATDPTFAVFLALRVCGEPQAALKLIERLHTRYGVVFSPQVHSIVSETCFRAQRIDLATRLRKLVQKQFETIEKKSDSVQIQRETIEKTLSPKKPRGGRQRRSKTKPKAKQ